MANMDAIEIAYGENGGTVRRLGVTTIDEHRVLKRARKT